MTLKGKPLGDTDTKVNSVIYIMHAQMLSDIRPLANNYGKYA